mgnify:CR=1 FL=1
MGRIGFRDVAELKQALALVNQPAFVFEGLFTHFATADAADDTYFKQQLGRWHEFLAAVDQKPPYVHMANSAVGMWHRETIAANTVRMGISMYGCNPSGHELPDSLDLQPVASIVAKTTFVKYLHWRIHPAMARPIPHKTMNGSLRCQLAMRMAICAGCRALRS